MTAQEFACRDRRPARHAPPSMRLPLVSPGAWRTELCRAERFLKGVPFRLAIARRDTEIMPKAARTFAVRGRKEQQS